MSNRKTHRPSPRTTPSPNANYIAPVLQEEFETGTVRNSVRVAQITLDFLEQGVEDLERRVQRPPQEETKAGGVGQLPAEPRSSIAGDIDALELRISRLGRRVRYVVDAI